MSPAPNDNDWENPVNGDWSVPGDWSGGIPSGAAAQATIAQAGTYTVTIAAGESYGVDAVTLDAAAATLLLDGGLATTQGVALQAGTIEVGGTLAGPLTDAGVLIEQVSGPTSFATPVTLDGGELTWLDSQTGTADVTLPEGEVISGDGYISDPSGYAPSGDAPVILTNFGTIADGAQDYLLIETATLINQGVISTAGGDLQIADSSFTNAAAGTVSTDGDADVSLYGGFRNAGLVSVSGGVLSLGSSGGGAWQNTGTILADGALVQVYGDESLADFGAFSLAGGASLEFGGTLENAGGTLDASDGALRGVQLEGGTIVGGVLDPSVLQLGFSQSAFYQGSGNVLDGVSVINGLTITGGLVSLENGSTVYADAGQTIGTAAVGAGGTLALVSNAAIDQPVAASGGEIILAGGFTLEGTLAAAGGTLLIGLGTLVYDSASGTYSEANPGWVNQGSILASDSNIYLAGDETAQQIGSISDPGGVVYLTGTLENTGSVLGAADSSLIGLRLFGGTIEGGTIDAAALDFAVAQNYGVVADLDNVTVIGDLTVTGSLVLSGNTVIYQDAAQTMPGTLTIGYGGSVVYEVASGATTLANSVVLAGGALGWQLPGLGAGSVNVTIAAGQTISGYGYIADPERYDSFGAAYDTIDNLGTITANGGDLLIAVGSFANQGSLLANGYDLELDYGTAGVWSNSGTIAAFGYGLVQLGGSFVNSGLIAGSYLYIGDGTSTYDAATGVSSTLYPDWVNFGTISSANGYVYLTGDETVLQIGTILRSGEGGLEYIGGTLDNIGSLLNSADVSLLNLQLAGGTIEGGTLDPASLGFGVPYESGQGDLDNVAVINSLTIDGELGLSGSTAVYSSAAQSAPGTIVVQDDGDLAFIGAGPATLVNPLLLDYGSVNWTARPGFDAAGTVDATIAAGVSVAGDGYIADEPAAGQVVDLVNLGTIIADQAYGELEVADSAIDNAGTMLADNGALLLLGEQHEVYDPQTGTYDEVYGAVLNTGTIIVNGASLAIIGDETVGELGSIQLRNGVLLYAGGTLDNSGQTLDGSDTSLLGLQLAGGTIEGGTIDVPGLQFSAADQGYYSYSRSRLDNVTVTGNLTVADALALTGGTRVYSDAAASQAGTITIASGGTLIYATGTQYTARDHLLLAGGAVTWESAATLAGTVDVTIEAGQSITGYGSIIDDYDSGAYVSLVNAGTIAADVSGENLLIGTEFFTNTGLLSATGGGALTLGRGTYGYNAAGAYVFSYPTWVNSGTILVSDASLYLAGDETVGTIGTIVQQNARLYLSGSTLDNVGSVLGSADISLLGLQLDGGTIEGGTIDVAGLGFAVADGGDLDNVAIAGNLLVTGGDLTLSGSAAVSAGLGQSSAGDITVENGEVIFNAATSFVLSNNVTLDNGSLGWTEQSGGTYGLASVTIAAGVTVSGSGNLLSGVGNDSVTNDGTVVASGRYADLFIDTTTFSNAGVLLAENGGAIYLDTNDIGNLANGVLSGGTLYVAANSAIESFGTVSAIAADVVLGANAYLSFASTVTQIAAGGTLELDAGGVFADANTITVGGTLLLVGGALDADAVDLAGGTIIGYGTINAASIIDAGTIIADGGALTLAGAVSGAPDLVVGDFATLALAGASSQNVQLSGLDSTVVLENSGTLYQGAISGFAGGDQLIVAGFNGTAASWDAGLLTLSGATGEVQVNLPGTYASDAFNASVPVLGQSSVLLSAGASISLDTPGSLFDNPGTVLTVGGVAVLDVASATLAVTVSDLYGVLAASPEDGGIVQGNGTGTLALSGGLAAVDDALATLEYRAPLAGQPTDSILVSATDGNGGRSSTVIAVTINQPPTITLPSQALALAGTASMVPDLAIDDPDAQAGEIYSATIADSGGALAVSAVSGVSEIGSGTTLVTLSGALGGVNQALASLSFTGNGNDSLAITANDGRGGLSEGFVPVYVDHPPEVAAPGTVQGYIGTLTDVRGISVVDPYGSAVGDMFGVVLEAGVGTLSVDAVSGVTLDGDNTSTLTLGGPLAAVNDALASLQYAATLSGYISDTIGIGAADGQGGEGFGSIDVLLPTPPVLTLPADFIVGGGHESPLDGISVAVGQGLAGNTQVTLDLSDTNGTLSVKIDSGVTVIGNGGTNLELIGDVAALNTALSSLIYTGGSSNDTHRLLDGLVFVASEDGATTAAEVAVDQPVTGSAGGAAQDFPVGVLTTGNYYGGAVYLQWDQGGNGYVGTLYADLPVYYGPNKEAAAAEITFSVFNNNISSETDGASAIQEPYAPVIGQFWRSSTPASINGLDGFFATGSLFTATDLDAQQPDQITFTIKSTGNEAGQLPDRRLTVVFNKTTSITEPSPTSTTTGGFHHHLPLPPPPNPPPLPPHRHGGGSGDVHLTTFDGLYYDFQAVGEFVFAKSTQPGDSFQIQVRLQPWTNSASVSVITEAAVALGSDRITFDLDRTDTVWLNGAAIALTTGSPVDLGAGTLTQLTPTSWEVLYDSGETVTITNAGTFLVIDATLPASAPAGAVEGLLGNDNGTAANDLSLPDGTVLAAPLSYAQLYTTFADAWRVSQATSLLDYGPGQTTATFTDLSFPSDSVSLSNLPANILQNAQELVQAAGISNPAAEQGAIEDYALTGDAAFITAVAQTGATEPALTVMPNPVSPTTMVGVGVAALANATTLSASGTTTVGFEIYSTGTFATAETITYAAVIAHPGDLGAAAFAGGVLPGGTVVIAAGQTSAMLMLDVLGTLGALPSAQVDLQISAAGVPVIGASADALIDNDVPVPGTAAVPVFLDPDGIGTLTQDGTAFVLALGTFFQAGTAPALVFDIANAGAAGANTLFGNVTETGSPAISFTGGLRPVASLIAGQTDPFNATVLTGQLGTIATTVTFDANVFNASGYQAAMTPVTLTIEADIIDQPPTLVIPPGELALAGTTVALPGISVINTGAAAATKLFTVTLADSFGTLSAGAADGGAVIGSLSDHLTLTGGLTAVNAELASLQFTGASADSVSMFVNDGAGGTTAGSFAIDLDSAPVISAPGSLTGVIGAAVTLAGVSISDPAVAAAGSTLSVLLRDGSGSLFVPAVSGLSVIGDGGTLVTLSGSLAALDTALAGLTDTALASPNPDMVHITASDTLGLAGSASVSVASVPPPPPGITAPGSLDIAAAGTAAGIGAYITLADSDAAAAAQLTVTVSDLSGTLAVSASQGGTVTGSGSDTLVLRGNLAQVNADLAGLTYTGAVAAYDTADSTSDTVALHATDAFGSTAAQTLTLSVAQIPFYQSAFSALDTLNSDAGAGAGTTQLVADALAFYSSAVSGAIGSLGGTVWQRAYDASTQAAATLSAAAASGSVPLADTVALLNTVVAGSVGAVAAKATPAGYAAILAAATALGNDIVADAGSAALDADLSVLYGAIVAAAPDAADPAAFAAAQTASAQSASSLSADIAGGAGSGQILADVGSLYDSIVAGALGAIGGSALQAEYGNDAPTASTLTGDVSAGASAARIAQDLTGVYETVIAGVASPGSTRALDAVLNAASPFAAALGSGETPTQIVSAALPLYNAIAVNFIDGQTGGSDAQVLLDVETSIAVAQSAINGNASTTAVSADIDNTVQTSISGMLSILGLAAGEQAFAASLQYGQAAAADLAAGSSISQFNIDIAAYMGALLGSFATVSLGASASQFQAIMNAFAKLASDVNANLQSQATNDFIDLYTALTAAAGSTATRSTSSGTVSADEEKAADSKNAKQAVQLAQKNKDQILQIFTDTAQKNFNAALSAYGKLTQTLMNDAVVKKLGNQAAADNAYKSVQSALQFLLTNLTKTKNTAALNNAYFFNFTSTTIAGFLDFFAGKKGLFGKTISGLAADTVQKTIDQFSLDVTTLLKTSTTGIRTNTNQLGLLAKELQGLLENLGPNLYNVVKTVFNKLINNANPQVNAYPDYFQRLINQVHSFLYDPQYQIPVSENVFGTIIGRNTVTPIANLPGLIGVPGALPNSPPADDSDIGVSVIGGVIGGIGNGGIGNGGVGAGGTTGGGGGIGAAADGDVHLTTFDGLYYNFQAAGEFILAKSTQPGDSFQIQIRLQPWSNSAAVSVITEAAVALGSDRITFDINRTNTVWLNGAPVSLTTGTPLDLPAGTLTQLTATSWEVLYDSGETVTITDAGSFLDVTPTIPASTPLNSIEGLLGNDNGDASLDLSLPNGTVLQQPLTYSELYTTFANAWRVTQANALLDYGTGQSTATFTDGNFPADAATIVPASVLAQAASLVADAGITNPTLAAGAAEDYALTGDPAFINAAAEQENTAAGPALILADPTPPNPAPGVGVASVWPDVLLSASGTTAVSFLIYSTGTSAIAQAVTYAAELPGSGLTAGNFAGDVLPVGTITIAAGQTMATLTLDVLGSLGNVPAGVLELALTGAGAAVVAPTAQVSINNDQAVAGIDAVPAFLAPGDIGAFTQVGQGFTLDLGDLAQGRSVAALAIDIANQAIGAADTLFGDETYTSSGAIDFTTGLPPVVSLTAGEIDTLQAGIDTSVAGTIATTVTFDANEFNASGYQAALTPITLTITGDIIPPGPTLILPPAELALSGVTVPLFDLSLIDIAPAAANNIFTLTLSDTAGLLDGTAASGGSVSGSGTGQLVLTGSLAAVNAELAELTLTGTAADTIKLSASDGAGGTATGTVGVVLDSAPVLRLPGSFTAPIGQLATIAGVSIAAPALAAAGATPIVEITDTAGRLGASEFDGDTVEGGGPIGAGNNTLILVGSLAALNASLATLTDVAVAGSDTLQVQVLDPLGLAATGSIAVSTVTPPGPVLSAPGSFTVPLGTAATLSGVSVSDPGLAGAGGSLSVTLSDAGALIASGDTMGDATIIGAGTTLLTISGTLAGVNDALGVLSLSGPASPGSDQLAVQTTDPLGQSATADVALLLDSAPQINLPASVILPLGTAAGAGGLSISDPALSGTLGVVLSDGIGLLSVPATSGVSVGGAGTTLSLYGSLSALNAALAALSVTGPGTPALDSLTVRATDPLGLTGSASLPIEFDTAPVLTLPVAVGLSAGSTGTIGGIGLSDAGVAARGGTLVVSVRDAAVALSATPGSGATVSGTGSTTLTLAGQVGGVAAGLASLTGTVAAGFTADSLAVQATDPFGLQSSGSVPLTAEVPCFLRGTALATPGGDIAVEDLAVGDLVCTAGGAARRVRWIGQRSIDCRRSPWPERVWPVRIAAGAFADGVPARPLYLSPDHAVFVDGRLIPALHLLNGATVRQEPAARVQYFHVELESHDILLAEGLAVESYLDTGNRDMFHGGGAALALHPEFAVHEWDAACAPLCLTGAPLTAARQALLARAAALGWVLSTAPGLRLLAGARRLAPTRVQGGLHGFLLPPGTRQVTLTSPCGLAGASDPRSEDRRLLGVQVAGMLLDGRRIALDSADLLSGFYAPEKDGRWTDGNGVVALRAGRVLEVQVRGAMAGWVEEESKDFFFEKKKQKTFIPFAPNLTGSKSPCIEGRAANE